MGAGLERRERKSARTGWMAAMPLAAVVAVVTAGGGSGSIATPRTTLARFGKKVPETGG